MIDIRDNSSRNANIFELSDRLIVHSIRPSVAEQFELYYDSGRNNVDKSSKHRSVAPARSMHLFSTEMIEIFMLSQATKHQHSR